MTYGRGGGGEGLLRLIIFAGYVLLASKSILWPIDPTLSIFKDPILLTLCLCIYVIQPFN